MVIDNSKNWVEKAAKTVNRLLDEIPARKEECRKAGKHKQFNENPYVVSSRSNPLRDKVHGVCTYCLTFIGRPLNSQERQEIVEFWGLMNQPMTY
jgi:hypothetical protein